MVSVIKRYGALPVLAVLGILVYSNIFHAPFVFDDLKYIVENPAIRELKNFLYPSGTRYIAFLSFAVNYAAGGYDTLGYHIANVFIHIANGFSVYFLVLLIFKTPAMKDGSGIDESLPWGLALLASLIFLGHPIQTQAVTYTTQRFATLATFFYLASLLLYLKARLTGLEEKSGPGANIKYWGFYLGALFSGIIAQKTKEISFTLPAIIALTEFTFFGNQGEKARRFIRLIPFVLLFAIIPLSLFGPGLAPGGPMGIEEKLRALQLEELATLSSYEYFVTQLRVIVTYLRLLVFPVSQNLDYDYPVYHSIFETQVLFSLIFLSALFSCGIYLLIRSKTRVKNPYLLLVSFGIIWFFITLSIESSIVPIKDVIYEHRVYLPSTGAVFVFAGLFFFILDKARKRYPGKAINPAAWSVVFIVVAVLSFAAHQRNTVWKDELIFWQDVVKKSPGKARGYSNLGNVFMERGRLKAAAGKYRQAIKLKEDYYEAYNNLGVMFLETGRPEIALRNFTKAVELKDNYAEAINNSGIALVQMGRIAEGIEHSVRALDLKPGFAPAHNNLGIALAKLGRTDEAIRHFEEAILLKPRYADAHNNLGVAMLQTGRPDQAIERFRTALGIRPEKKKYRENLERAIRLSEGRPW